VASLATNASVSPDKKSLLSGSGKIDTHLVIVATSSRGLCGGFNSSISKAAMVKINRLVNEGKKVKILCIGRKGYDSIKRFHKEKVLEVIEDVQKNGVNYTDVDQISKKIIELFFAGEFDVCTIFYNKFESAIAQIVTEQQLIPLEIDAEAAASVPQDAVFEYEPEEEEILDSLLPKNLSVQIFSALIENQASEMGARMTAMDNATRNAGDMIDKLTLVYNRTRQAAITTELIEIISGSEAL